MTSMQGVGERAAFRTYHMCGEQAEERAGARSGPHHHWQWCDASAALHQAPHSAIEASRGSPEWQASAAMASVSTPTAAAAGPWCARAAEERSRRAAAREAGPEGWWPIG